MQAKILQNKIISISSRKYTSRLPWNYRIKFLFLLIHQKIKITDVFINITPYLTAEFEDCIKLVYNLREKITPVQILVIKYP